MTKGHSNKRLTSDDLREANKLGATIGNAREQINICRGNLDNAFASNVDQTSARWHELSDALENAIQKGHQAVQAEVDWWQKKMFNADS